MINPEAGELSSMSIGNQCEAELVLIIGLASFLGNNNLSRNILGNGQRNQSLSLNAFSRFYFWIVFLAALG